MINLVNGINSLSDFKRNTSDFLKQLRETGEPVVLTINGRAQVVVQDAVSYQRLIEITERIESIEALRPAIEEMRAGKGEPADSVLAQVAAIKQTSRSE